MAVSKAQQKAVTKYVKFKYDRFGLTMPKGNLDAIKAHAEARSESVNSFIGRAIAEAMARDGAGGPQEATEQFAGAMLSPDTLEAAQRAAEATGEAVGEFLARAVETQTQRDKSSLTLGINPATGDKMKGEA